MCIYIKHLDALIHILPVGGVVPSLRPRCIFTAFHSSSASAPGGRWAKLGARQVQLVVGSKQFGGRPGCGEV